jgi:hypothetical protein
MRRRGCQSKLSFETLTISNVQVQQFLEQHAKPLCLIVHVARKSGYQSTLLSDVLGAFRNMLLGQCQVLLQGCAVNRHRSTGS